MVIAKRHYIVKPYESVGDLKFGMTQLEIEHIIGKSNEIIDDKVMGEIRENRNDFVLVYIRKKLVDIRFSEKHNLNEINIFLEDINLCNTLNIIDTLSNYPNSKPSKIFKGYINFYGLGINFSGIGKTKSKEGKEIRFFAMNRKKYYELYLKA
jgi:hypothetical protein